jgi:hypothetical protein
MKRVGKDVILTDDEVIKEITDFIKDADADDLARIVGDVFGGTCFVEPEDEEDNGSDIIYRFVPNKDYSGAFEIVS